MQKVIVIGCPGSGKSIFSKALHHVTGGTSFLYKNVDDVYTDVYTINKRR